MDWTSENTLKFVHAYGKHPCLWDPTHPQRINRFRRTEAWHAIKKELGDLCTLEELRKKKECLMATYRLCKAKVMRSETESKYEPSWFAYLAMDVFLGWIYETCPTPSMKTEGKQHISADSSNYQEEECDSNTNSDPEKWKEENYVIIVTPPEPQRENPLELPIKLDDRVVNSSIKYEIQNDSDDEQGTADCTPMNWSNEDVLRFIELYKGHPCLWDPTHPWRRSKQRIANAWNTIKTDLGDRCTVEELKKKKESLLSMYRLSKTKVIKSEYTDCAFQPSWFAYSAIDDFLGSVYKCSVSSNRNKSRDQNNTADSSYCQDESDSNGDSERDNGENYVSIVSTSALKRRNPLEPPMELVDMELKKPKCEPPDEDDECSLFGKLVTTKLRKVPQDRRDWLMLKINELFYKENQGSNAKSHFS